MDWKYVLTSFEGRINRKPFWLALLALLVVAWILEYLIFAMFGGGFVIDPSMTPEAQAAAMSAMWGRVGVPLGILFLILLWPDLALYTKRWHDRNKSGWWTLIVLVPFIGALWLLIECGFLRGTEGPNRFGDDPLAGR